MPVLALTLTVGTLPAATAWAWVYDTARPTIEWSSAIPSGPTSAVLVVGLPREVAAAMATAAPSDPRWNAIFTVHLVSKDGTVPTGRPAMVGQYRLADPLTLVFTPSLPLDPARPYRATFDPDGPSGPVVAIVANRANADQLTTPTTTVQTIEPTASQLPANILRFYVHFSAPMGRGEAYAHLKLVNATGLTLDHPFLELGEELWDPTGTRLTILFDPGRIKRGLRPHEELGPIFQPGQTYTLKIDPSWCDASGLQLAAPAAKTFTTGPTDENSPTPATWTISSPSVGSRSPLIITFHDTLDRATVASGLTLINSDGKEALGTSSAHADGSGWTYIPDLPWSVGLYQLIVNPDLEDLVGNSIRRPFEVDIQRDVPVGSDTTQIRLPVVITP